MLKWVKKTPVPPALKYKTQLCRHYQQNRTCALGATCSYAHGMKELRRYEDPMPRDFPGLDEVGVRSNYKTQLC